MSHGGENMKEMNEILTKIAYKTNIIIFNKPRPQSSIVGLECLIRKVVASTQNFTTFLNIDYSHSFVSLNISLPTLHNTARMHKVTEIHSMYLIFWKL